MKNQSKMVEKRLRKQKTFKMQTSGIPLSGSDILNGDVKNKCEEPC